MNRALLCAPRVDPSCLGAAYSGLRALQWALTHKMAMLKDVLGFNWATSSDWPVSARSSSSTCTSRKSVVFISKARVVDSLLQTAWIVWQAYLMSALIHTVQNHIYQYTQILVVYVFQIGCIYLTRVWLPLCVWPGVIFK